MAQPQPYNRQFNFADQQAQTPSTPLPATEVDAEFNAVKLTFDQTLANLAKIQRDDGALKNGIVTADSIAYSLSIGFTLRGAWAPDVNYLRLDGVTYANAFWQAEASHLSVAGQTPDAQPLLWSKLVDFNDFAPAVIADNSVTNSKLRDSAGLSVIGRSGDTGGDPADIVAAADGQVLRRSGTTLSFGTVDTAGLTNSAVSTAKVADDAITNAKLANMAVNTLKGRITTGTGDPEDLTLANLVSMLGVQANSGVSGYAVLPGASGTPNIIIQWGVASNAAADFTVPFNITFPNACRQVLATPQGFPASNVLYAVTCDGPSTSSFVLRGRYAVSGGTVGTQPGIAISWIAVGY